MEENVWHHQPDMFSWRRDWEYPGHGIENDFSNKVRLVQEKRWFMDAVGRAMHHSGSNWLRSDDRWSLASLPSNGTLTHPQNNDGNRFRITMSHHKESCLLFAIVRIRGQWLWRSRYNTNKMNEQYSKTWNIELHYIITVITYNTYININSANMSINIWRFPKVGVPPVLIHLMDGCATK